MTKTCSKCKKELPVEEFYKSNGTKDGLTFHCKSCKKQYYQENKERFQQYYQANKERIYQQRKHYKKQYYLKNKEMSSQYNHQYYQENRVRIRKQRGLVVN